MNHHDVSVFDGVEVLRACRRPVSLAQAIAGRRMAHARAGIDVVVAESCTDQLLHQERLFIGAARRRNAADGILAVLGLDAL
jgi:hypothetical protein